MSLQQLFGLGLLCGFAIGTCAVLHDVGSRLNAIEAKQKQQAAIVGMCLDSINMCLDSINELANPGGSITVENTVEERPR